MSTELELKVCNLLADYSKEFNCIKRDELLELAMCQYKHAKIIIEFLKNNPTNI